MVILMLFLAVCAGALLSIQAAINARLSQSVGVLRTAFLTFALGALITTLLVIFLEPIHTENLMTVPKWQLIGAFLGVPYILIMAFAVQRVGVATATVAVIFGQLVMSLMIDKQGWLNNTVIEFSWRHAVASICLILALLCIYKSSQATGVESKNPTSAN